MIIETNTLKDIEQIQPYLNVFISKDKFPEDNIIFICFPEEKITLYSKYNNYLSPYKLPYSEALSLKPPQGIGCLFLKNPYKFDESLFKQELLSSIKKEDTENLDYYTSSRKPRYDLHSIDSEGYLISIYCKGISLDYMFKPKEGLVQVACTKNIQFKKDSKKYFNKSLKDIGSYINEYCI